jgi:hypothetical protein
MQSLKESAKARSYELTPCAVEGPEEAKTLAFEERGSSAHPEPPGWRFAP